MISKIIMPALLISALAAAPAFAQNAVAALPKADSGDSAWILTASALVLMMTLPGLALFYGGLVRAKNFLSVLVQCGAVAALASVIWIVIGYSLAFSVNCWSDSTLSGSNPVNNASNSDCMPDCFRKRLYPSIVTANPQGT
jgi:ammonia channel protein AmtB